MWTLLNFTPGGRPDCGLVPKTWTGIFCPVLARRHDFDLQAPVHRSAGHGAPCRWPIEIDARDFTRLRPGLQRRCLPCFDLRRTYPSQNRVGIHRLVSANTTALDIADSHLASRRQCDLREVDRSLSEATDIRIQRYQTFALRGAKVCKWWNLPVQQPEKLTPTAHYSASIIMSQENGKTDLSSTFQARRPSMLAWLAHLIELLPIARLSACLTQPDPPARPASEV